MRVFVVALDADGAVAGALVRERLKERISSFYELSPTVFAITADMLSNDVAEMAGLKGEDRLPNATGAVFRIDSYSGFTNRALWEWLEGVED